MFKPHWVPLVRTEGDHELPSPIKKLFPNDIPLAKEKLVLSNDHFVMSPLGNDNDWRQRLAIHRMSDTIYLIIEILFS